MQDLIQQIKATEKNAQAIITQAQEKAQDNLKQAQSETANQIQAAKNQILAKIHKQKAEKEKAIQSQKLRLLQKHFSEFTGRLSHIENQKIKARDFLMQKIDQMLNQLS
jgi:vacuolar-type H+-ATPase subunit H